MQRKCLDCKEPLLGRADQKFCSDQCRNHYNNSLNSDVTNYVRNINNALRKNRRILSELNPTDKTTVSKGKLMERGFDFNYYTNTYITQKGSVYYFCYEYGYLPIEKDNYVLVKRNNNK